jgi:hypothetical protein
MPPIFKSVLFRKIPSIQKPTVTYILYINIITAKNPPDKKLPKK